jgi:hypothetical protein
MLASVFPLVDKDFPKLVRGNLNTNELKQNINALVRNNLVISQGIFK